MPEIHHEIKVEAPRATVFDALSTADGLASWHASSVGGSGEVGTDWVFDFANGPEFHWQVRESRPTERIEWVCTGGPGDAVGTTATFTLSDTDDGRTLVEHVHAGWPGTHGNFRKCNTFWGVLLHHLSQYIETGQAATPFDE